MHLFLLEGYTCISQIGKRKTKITCKCYESSPKHKFLAHLSWKLKWAFLITCCLSVCLSVCPSVCKCFTFSFSFQEPQGQFQPNLGQASMGDGDSSLFKWIKVHALFQGEIIGKYWKYTVNFKIFFLRTTGPILTKHGPKHDWVKGIQVCSNEGSCPKGR